MNNPSCLNGKLAYHQIQDCEVHEAILEVAKTTSHYIKNIELELRLKDGKIELLNESLQKMEERLDESKCNKMVEKMEYELRRVITNNEEHREMIASLVRDRKNFKALEARVKYYEDTYGKFSNE